MIESLNQLMSAVLVASTAFLGLTLVHLAQLKTGVIDKKELKRSRRPILWSFIAGIFTVLLAILYFTNYSPWGALPTTIAVIIQINLFWPEVVRFWTSTR